MRSEVPVIKGAISEDFEGPILCDNKAHIEYDLDNLSDTVTRVLDAARNNFGHFNA